MVKHRRDMPSVCDLLYERTWISNSQSAEVPWLMTSTYLVCKERFGVALEARSNPLKHKFSQKYEYSAEESTVGKEVSIPTNWLPLPSSNRGRKRGRKMGKDWT